MTKKTQRKPKNRRGPTFRQVGSAIAQQYPSIAEQAAKIGQGLVRSAIRVGEHRARAALLAPILNNLRDVEKSKHGSMTCLTASASRIVLACLAEAGYVPQDEHVSAQVIKPDASWSGVPGDGTEPPKPDMTKTVSENARRAA